MTGLSVTDVTEILGDKAVVRVTAPSLLRQFAGSTFLTLTADPATPGEFLSDYVPIACMGWPLFHQSDTVATNDVPWVEHLLKPSAIEAALQVLKTGGFDISNPYSSLGTFAKAVADFKLQNPTKVEPLALRPAYLQQIETGAAAIRPKAPYKYATQLQVRAMANPDSQSYAPCAQHELVAAPRILPASRYATSAPYLQSIKTLNAWQFKHNGSLEARLQAKETAADMELEQEELVGQFYSESSFPLSAITLPSSKLDRRDPRRAELFNAMCDWAFTVAKRPAVITKYFMNLLKAETYLAKIVLPAPDAMAAQQNVTMLRAIAAPKVTGPISIELLSMMNDGIKARNLHAPVDTDERRAELGESKTKLVIDKTDVMVATASGTATSNTAAGQKDHAVSAETQAWLLSTAAQKVESEFQDALIKDELFTAIMVLSRSRNGLFMQLLVNRNNIGSAELWKRAKALRGQMPAAFSFAVTARRRGGSDPAKANELVQPMKLDTFEIETSFMDLFWGKDSGSKDGSQRGQWQKIDPHALLYNIKRMQRGSYVSKFNISVDRIWGDFTQNTNVLPFLDAAFHFSGYKNGVFTDFIAPANAILNDNSNLAVKRLASLQRKVTAAVKLGLQEAGIPYSACFTTNSHMDGFPEEGKQLLPDDSKYSRRLARIQSKLDKLSDEEFWSDDDTTDNSSELQQKLKSANQRLNGVPTSPLLF